MSLIVIQTNPSFNLGMQHPHQPPLEKLPDTVNDFYQAPLQGTFTSQEDVAVWPLVPVTWAVQEDQRLKPVDCNTLIARIGKSVSNKIMILFSTDDMT